MLDTATSLRSLSDTPESYRDPVGQVNWEQLDTERDWLPESALSLYGLPEYETIPPEVKLRLSQYEFISAMQCVRWLDGMFFQHVSRRFHVGLWNHESAQALRMVREKAGHSLMVLKMIEASDLPVPAGAWAPPRLVDLIARNAPVSDILFWLSALIAGDVPDRFNRCLRKYGTRLHPVIRQICTLHVTDQAQHFNFACSQLDLLLETRRFLDVELFGAIGKTLIQQISGALYFPPSRFYELAGLSSGASWRRLAHKNPERHRFIEECLAPTHSVLKHYQRSTWA